MEPLDQALEWHILEDPAITCKTLHRWKPSATSQLTSEAVAKTQSTLPTSWLLVALIHSLDPCICVPHRTAYIQDHSITYWFLDGFRLTTVKTCYVIKDIFMISCQCAYTCIHIIYMYIDAEAKSCSPQRLQPMKYLVFSTFVVLPLLSVHGFAEAYTTCQTRRVPRQRCGKAYVRVFQVSGPIWIAKESLPVIDQKLQNIASSDFKPPLVLFPGPCLHTKWLQLCNVSTFSWPAYQICCDFAITLTA